MVGSRWGSPGRYVYRYTAQWPGMSEELDWVIASGGSMLAIGLGVGAGVLQTGSAGYTAGELMKLPASRLAPRSPMPSLRGASNRCTADSDSRFGKESRSRGSCSAGTSTLWEEGKRFVHRQG